MGALYGLITVADGMRIPCDFSDAGNGRKPFVKLVEPSDASKEVLNVYQDAEEFFAMDAVPNVLKFWARDPFYLRYRWHYIKVALSDGPLNRFEKACIAFGASFAARSEYAIDLFHHEATRLGLTEQGMMEIVEVVDHFAVNNKIAETLQLDPDMGTERI